jgi:hypothetical protein
MQLGQTGSVKELIELVEKSTIPLAEEEELFYEVKRKHTMGVPLSKMEEGFLLNLAAKASQWEKGVQSSALTEREETLSG